MVATPNLNGAVHKALTTRDLWTRRIKNSRPIVPVHILELDDPTDADEPEAWVLLRAMSGSEKEDWQFRRINEEQYEPDPALAQQQDRNKTWGQVLKGNKHSLVAESVVDEAGRRIWSQHDVAELADANAAALERLYAKAVQLNGLPRNGIPDHLAKWLEEDEAGARAAVVPPETLAKNSAGGPTKPSSSSSPVPPADAT